MQQEQAQMAITSDGPYTVSLLAKICVCSVFVILENHKPAYVDFLSYRISNPVCLLASMTAGLCVCNWQPRMLK